MKKYFNGIIIIILTLCIFFGYSYFQSMRNRVDAAELSVVAQGQEYIEKIKKRIKVWRKFPDIEDINFGKSDIEVDGSKRVLLTFAPSRDSDYQRFFPLYRDLARTYKEFQVVVGYELEPPEEEVRELKSAGIQVITISDYLKEKLGANYNRYRSLLLNESGRAVYGLYTQDMGRWQSYELTIRQYAAGQEVKDNHGMIIKMGQPLILSTIKDINGNLHNPRTFRGQPNVFFLVPSEYEVNFSTYPVIKRLEEEYQDEINLNLILYNYQEVVRKATNNYNLEYNLPIDKSKEAGPTIKELTKDMNLTKVPIIYDRDNILFNYFQFDVTPTVIICDENLKIVDLISLGSESLADDNSSAIKGISQVIDKILD